mgnify:CR=1 FL=1
MIQNKQKAILKEDFFSQSNEVVFRSLAEVIKLVGKKYYAVRGKKIDKIIHLIKSKSSFKVTLGDCIIKKVNQTLILSKE